MLSFMGLTTDEEDDTVSELSLQEVIYTVLMVAICYFLRKMEVNVDDLLAIMGAVVGVYLSYFWPTWLHLKCILYDNSSGFINDIDERNLKVQTNPCSCRHTYASTITLYLEAAFLLTITGFAVFFFTSLMPKSMQAT